MDFFKPSQKKMNGRLRDAVENNDVEAVKKWLEAGAEPNVSAGHYEDSLLFFALKADFYEIFQQLVNSGASLTNQKWYDDQDILMKTMTYSKGSRQRYATYLLKTASDRLDFDQQDDEGRTALMLAYLEKQANILDCLEQKSGKLTNVTKLIDQMIVSGDLDGIKILKDRGYDICERNKNKGTPLHLAAKVGKLKIVQYFVETQGVDVDALNKDHTSPLILAAEKGEIDIVSYLLSKGAKPEHVNKKGVSASYAALIQKSKKREQCVDVMIKEMSSDQLNTPLKDQETLLTLAVRKKAPQLIEKILSAGGDINLKGKEGSTPLHLSIAQNDFVLFETFLKAGAKANILNNKGKTAKDEATGRTNPMFLECLKEQEANNNWVQTGEMEVAHTVLKKSLGLSVTEIFNFNSQDRMTLVKNIKSDHYDTMCREAFSQISNLDVIQQAADELVKCDPKIDKQLLQRSVKKTMPVNLPKLNQTG